MYVHNVMTQNYQCVATFSQLVGLQDPKQRRMFSADELGDLFTLGDDGASDGFTDTIDLFQVHHV